MSSIGDIVQQIYRGTLSPPPVAKLIGFTLTALQPGQAVIELKATAQHANPSALYTSHQGAFNHTLMPDRCHEEHLEVDAINQALRLSPHSHIRDVYNAESVALGSPFG